MTDTFVSEEPARLALFPITFFASVLGLSGLTLALHTAEAHFQVGHVVSVLSLLVTVCVFLSLAAIYVTKAIRHPKAVQEEWHHPVKLAFFPTISISLLLIATALRPLSMDLALGIWVVGMIGQAALTLAVISNWIGHRAFQTAHISPAWFIPAVGNLVVPIAGLSFGFIELSWLFFSIGLIFWIILLTLVMNRLIFHDPLPGRLLPTLVILIAPPAIGFLAWLQLNEGVLDAFGRVLYYNALGFAAIVAMQARGFTKLPFALSWWALSFPIAALTLATFRYGTLSASGPHLSLALGFLALLVAIIIGLVSRTLLAVSRNEICQPE